MHIWKPHCGVREMAQPSRALAVRSWGLEFRSQHPWDKSGTWQHTWELNSETNEDRMITEAYWLLVQQKICEPKFGDPASKKQWSWRTLNSPFLVCMCVPGMSTHVHIGMKIHTDTYKKRKTLTGNNASGGKLLAAFSVWQFEMRMASMVCYVWIVGAQLVELFGQEYEV